MDRICMYHDDMDGLASAYVVYKAVGDCEFIAMKYIEAHRQRENLLQCNKDEQ